MGLFSLVLVRSEGSVVSGQEAGEARVEVGVADVMRIGSKAGSFHWRERECECVCVCVCVGGGGGGGGGGGRERNY